MTKVPVSNPLERYWRERPIHEPIPQGENYVERYGRLSVLTPLMRLLVCNVRNETANTLCVIVQPRTVHYSTMFAASARRLVAQSEYRRWGGLFGGFMVVGWQRWGWGFGLLGKSRSHVVATYANEIMRALCSSSVDTIGAHASVKRQCNLHHPSRNRWN